MSTFPGHALAARFVVRQRHRVKLEPVVDELVAERRATSALQLLDLLGLEFDHLAGAQIDQMIVMGLGNCS